MRFSYNTEDMNGILYWVRVCVCVCVCVWWGGGGGGRGGGGGASNMILYNAACEVERQ